MVVPTRDDGTVWVAPTMSGIGLDATTLDVGTRHAGELDPDVGVGSGKAPWEDSSSEEEDGASGKSSVSDESDDEANTGLGGVEAGEETEEEDDKEEEDWGVNREVEERQCKNTLTLTLTLIQGGGEAADAPRGVAGDELYVNNPIAL